MQAHDYFRYDEMFTAPIHYFGTSAIFNNTKISWLAKKLLHEKKLIWQKNSKCYVKKPDDDFEKAKGNVNQTII